MADNTITNKTSDMPFKKVISTFTKSLGTYKKTFILALIFLAGEVAAENVLPYYTAILIDKIKAGSALDQIMHLGLVLIIFSLISLVSGSIAAMFAADTSTGLAKNLRRDMFYNVQTFSHANIDKFSAPSLVTRLTTDVDNIQRSFLMSIIYAIRGPFMLIFALIMAYKMAGQIALIFLAIIPLLTIALAIIIKNAVPYFTRVFRRYDKLNLTINENIHAIREVKSYVREDYEQSKFEKATFALFKDFEKAEKIVALVGPTMRVCMGILFTYVIYQGSWAIISSKATLLDVGQFSALITYGVMVMFSLINITFVFAMITMAEESAKRIAEVLVEKTTITNPQNAITTINSGSIEFDNVSFKYSPDAEEYVLKDINLTIPSGTTVGIIGATGSAKTSLAQLICRLYDTTLGSVLVNGTDTRKYDLDTLRGAVAIVEQKNMLFSGTIADNLRWGNKDATDEEIKEVCKIASADEFISGFEKGYDTEISQGGSNVSGGQKQRLCIARALLKHPKVLIFDDSTSAVDTKTDANIRASLKKYAPDTTKLIIAQRISSVSDADMIVVMNKGRIESVGTHDELLTSSDIYSETFKSQTRKSVEEGGLE